MLERLWIFVLNFFVLVDAYFVEVCVHGFLIYSLGTYYEV
jgi:hypothetical protein